MASTWIGSMAIGMNGNFSCLDCVRNMLNNLPIVSLGFKWHSIGELFGISAKTMMIDLSAQMLI